MELEFFASCLGGLERVLADELKSFGIERVRPLGGGAAFFCEPARALRACLWSRLASRIMLVVGRVNAGDADLLYAGVYDIAWEDVLSEDATMAVRSHGSNDELRNTRFTALKVKDAIADRLRIKRGARPDVDSRSPRASIDVRIHDRRATVSLDFSGEALNHRDYLEPDDKEDAPLACSKAAGALALAGWSERAKQGAAFVDPACRDGVLLVEAASIACDRAAGLGRERWGFQGWAHYDEGLWRSLVDEARERFEAGIARFAGADALEAPQSAPPDLSCVCFAGASNSSPAVSRARNHVRHAGLRQVASVEIGDASSAGPLVVRVANAKPKGGVSQGAMFVVSDIDAQARVDALAHVQSDEAAFAAAAGAAPAGSLFAAVDANDVAARFGVAPLATYSMGRGRAESTVEVFDAAPRGGTVIVIEDLAGGAPRHVEVLEPASDQFAARLRKVFKERRKWAAREGVTCYRIYDSDLPDYAVAIDWYSGSGDARGNNCLHIAEYAAPASVDAGKARRRWNDVLAIAPVVCGVRPDHVFSKRRVREKGGGQYRNAGMRAYPTTVDEGGYRFEVDLAGRLDTGLFLDHRITRRLIGEAAEGARFCNLFAYTGTASVYAAGGGAVETTTVDLSQTYLDWARRNMAANGFAGTEHRFERADVLRWITETRRAKARFDLIFVDPPTFSNSKAMGKKTWEVQRDHVELLIGVVHLLADEGLAIFSCNLRSFKPDFEQLARYGVEIEDISLDTIPLDFSRTPKIHKCYRVRRAEKRS
ncbi:MAG: bifunctional 23S rRNA (guanine(2069)-N(7))-methyltransferase RlmK/23S rRNA (guanine(2445)-N(2))-methyltransferase RlmL [Eggerthellaceae bacterium]|nr:bifunctional 23S rRNA (guanine(2069)-N(7))-methyltransferase RlmK/23S rRNA (guanine(2445)-N(2))-methyltransferase RlmL [Eggerthellaceae bacterium]